MLSEYRKMYEANANATLPKGWKNLNNNDLWRNCIEDFEKTNSNDSPWVSAIFVKYWSCMDGLYNKSKPFFTQEDIMDWFIECVLYTLSNHVWDNPNNKLYGDDNGPDKAFHVHLPCIRATAFQQANTFKRKANATYYSTEDCGGFNSLSNELEDDILFDKSLKDLQYKEVIRNFFERKDYFQAFLLDAILNYNMFDKDSQTNEISFSRAKLISHLKSLDELECRRFSDEYGFNYNSVIDSIKYITKLSKKDIGDRIDNRLFLYKKEDFVKENISDV